MTRKRLLEIETLALQLIQKTGILAFPISVNLMTQKYNIGLLFYDFADEISGVLVEKSGQFTIGCNKHHHENRQRFTIAHELGHYFLKHQRQGFFVDESTLFFRANASTPGESAQEREANAFAASLLMPKPFMEKYLLENKVDFSDDEALGNLAKAFSVSTGAMAFRLANLGIFQS